MYQRHIYSGIREEEGQGVLTCHDVSSLFILNALQVYNDEYARPTQKSQICMFKHLSMHGNA